MGLSRAEMARMTSDVEGGDAQPSSAAGPPPPAPRVCTHSSPVSSDVNAPGEVAGYRLAEKKGASSPREVPAPTSFFGSVQRDFEGWKRKCRLRSIVV